MNSRQIHRVLKQHHLTKHSFVGVFPSDCLPTSLEALPAAIVCNTDPISKPGQHWIALFIDDNGVGEYFDSYGQEPSVPDIKDFLHRNCDSWQHNPRTVQGMMSSTCGQYCLYYLLLRCRGWPMHRIVGSLPDSPFVSDSFVAAFVNKHLRLSTEAFESDVIVTQMCSAFGV